MMMCPPLTSAPPSRTSTRHASKPRALLVSAQASSAPGHRRAPPQRSSSIPRPRLGWLRTGVRAKCCAEAGTPSERFRPSRSVLRCGYMGRERISSAPARRPSAPSSVRSRTPAQRWRGTEVDAGRDARVGEMPSKALPMRRPQHPQDGSCASPRRGASSARGPRGDRAPSASARGCRDSATPLRRACDDQRIDMAQCGIQIRRRAPQEAQTDRVQVLLVAVDHGNLFHGGKAAQDRTCWLPSSHSRRHPPGARVRPRVPAVAPATSHLVGTNLLPGLISHTSSLNVSVRPSKTPEEDASRRPGSWCSSETANPHMRTAP